MSEKDWRAEGLHGPPMSIGHRSEPIQTYSTALTDADTLPKLQGVLEVYRKIANDAAAIVAAWSESDFADWRKALASERRGQFMGEPAAARFAAVLMPAVMFQVGVVASHYHAPWGTAYIRMRDIGQIEERDGIATMVQK